MLFHHLTTKTILQLNGLSFRKKFFKDSTFTYEFHSLSGRPGQCNLKTHLQMKGNKKID